MEPWMRAVQHPEASSYTAECPQPVFLGWVAQAGPAQGGGCSPCDLQPFTLATSCWEGSGSQPKTQRDVLTNTTHT